MRRVSQKLISPSDVEYDVPDVADASDTLIIEVSKDRDRMHHADRGQSGF